VTSGLGASLANSLGASRHHVSMSMSVAPGHVVGGHQRPVATAAFSPAGDRFVAGDLGGGLAVYRRIDRGRFETVASIRVPPSSQFSWPRIASVAWTPDGESIAVSECGSLRLRRPDDLSEVIGRFGGLRPTRPAGRFRVLQHRRARRRSNRAAGGGGR
jgi:hypothetical protein